jgi:phosphoglycerate dehydrogenase-like enzyme
MIGAAQLARMKRDAILVNVARGEIVDERALYQRLVAFPTFAAGIDAWWIEPVRHGTFRMDQAFMSLPNVIGSPHNSAAAIAGTGAVGLQRAVANIRRALAGETPLFLVPPEDRMM